MASYQDREHYIPVRLCELVNLLCAERGLPAADAEQFRRLAELLSATFHFEYHKLLDELKDLYAPFDPDAVTREMHPLTDVERTARLDRLTERFVFLMERANFKRLTRQELEAALQGSSAWGVDMDVDFRLFDRLEVFARGDGTGDRYMRLWYRFWKNERVCVPTYQRLVLLVKLRPSRRLPREIDTSRVFLKTFKDIPKMDLEMLLPGARLRMPGLQRLKLGSSLVGSGAWVGYGVFQQVLTSSLSTSLLLGPLAAVLGYGYKQWFGYQSTRNAFSLRLAQNLYFQTLGSNLSVLYHLLDEAEEQECREALLAYSALWRHAGAAGWTARDLDDYVEMEVERLTGLKIDFEIEDALAKLVRLRLVTKQGDHHVAVPIDKALEALDEAWDNYFKYNTEPGRTTVAKNA